MALPGGYAVGDKVFFTEPSHTFPSGKKLVHGRQGEVTGPATGENTKGKGVEVRFSGTRGLVDCPLDTVSRRPPPPLPGDYTLGDQVFYTAENYTFDDGDKLVHGQQGEVVGPAIGELTGKGVAVLFPGNKSWVGCPLSEVSRVDPNAAAAQEAAARRAAAERAAAQQALEDEQLAWALHQSRLAIAAAAEQAEAQRAAAEKAAAERAAAERALKAAMPYPFQLADPAKLQPAIETAKKAGVAGPTIEAAEAKLAKAVEKAKKAAERAAAQKAAAQKASEDEQLAWALRQSRLEQGATTSAPPISAPNLSEVPNSWTGPVDPLVASVVELQRGAEYNRVTAAFMASLGGRGITVVSVSRVQSLPMWTTYTAKRRSVLTREAQTSEARYERVWLFHGTDEDTVPKICQGGFNRSFCGKNATVYGKGVYFARNASYSSSVTYSPPNAQGVQHIFLARVVIGEYCRGVRDALAPPARNGPVLFDSTVDDVRNPTIFVTYHDAQAYPDYLVQFRQ